MKSHKIAHETPQNLLQLGLRPRPRWGRLRRSPRPSVGWGGISSCHSSPSTPLTVVVGRLYGQEGKMDTHNFETWLRPWVRPGLAARCPAGCVSRPADRLSYTAAAPRRDCLLQQQQQQRDVIVEMRLSLQRDTSSNLLSLLYHIIHSFQTCTELNL